MATSGNGIVVPQTDPSKYAEYEAEWSKLPLPENEGQWISRAREVAEILSNDAVNRHCRTGRSKMRTLVYYEKL